MRDATPADGSGRFASDSSRPGSPCGRCWCSSGTLQGESRLARGADPLSSGAARAASSPGR